MPATWTRSRKLATIEPELCGGRGCERFADRVCDYIDQWGWNCGQAFCDAHGLELAGGSFCHRHAAIYLTVGGDFEPLACELEDPFRRRPSLAAWVPRELDTDVRNLLCDAASVARGAPIRVTETVYAGDSECMVWETCWELDGPIPLSTSFVLDGFRDPAVLARTGAMVVMREFPEWLRHALYAEGVDEKTEAALRRDLFRRLHNALTAGVVPQNAPAGERAMQAEERAMQEVELDGLTFEPAPTRGSAA